jgi:hypothetical protein
LSTHFSKKIKKFTLIYISTYLYDSYDMENFNEKNKKMIGGRVPIEFADSFSDYCNKKGINRGVLFHNLAKWWIEHESIQWLMYEGKVSEAHSQIAKEVALAEADEIVTGAEADAPKQKGKKSQGRRAKSG